MSGKRLLKSEPEARHRADQDEAARRQPAAVPVVSAGAKVKKGQVVGRVEEGKLGADVHASIAGKVRAVSADAVEIVA